MQSRSGILAIARRSLALALVLGVAIVAGSGDAQQRDGAWDLYHLAVIHCRGPLQRPLAQGPGKRIVCSDGWVVRNPYDQFGVDPNIAWSLNPRYNIFFKAKIIYEAYPESQDEFDALVARHRIGQLIHHRIRRRSTDQQEYSSQRSPIDTSGKSPS